MLHEGISPDMAEADYTTIHFSTSIPPDLADEAAGLQGTPLLSEPLTKRYDQPIGPIWGVEVTLYDKNPSDVELTTMALSDSGVNVPLACTYTKEEVRLLGEGNMEKGVMQLGLFGYKGPILKAGSPRPSIDDIAKALKLAI